MGIQPVVLGTAGHIDHGKSTLVRALTGVDPDRLKEEKERGLTIDLGFAPLTLPDGRKVGIVDVPGHERFVRNMAAGASGIDLVVLVVAADDGVMPQTREHLQILELLGVRRGLVALTKIDLVPEELAELAEEDVREEVRGTFLEDAPLFRLSAVTGAGVEALRDVLFQMAAETEPRAADGVFRMPIQRVFSKPGLGTVVTGIPVSGSVGVGEVLEVLPGGARGRVRGIQAYHEAAERARAGHSTALNLSDVERGEARRGFVVAAPSFFAPKRMLAARLTALPVAGRPIENRMRIRVHTGTADPPGEIVLLDRREIEPGESGLVQLRLDEPVVAAPGDRFVLRLLSPVSTLGGGTILEESRHRLKRFKGFVVEELLQLERSLDAPEALLESVLARAGEELVSASDLAIAIKREPGETRALLAALEREGRAVSTAQGRWIHADRLASARARLAAALDAWFAENPARLQVETLELRRRAGFAPELLAALLEAEAAADRLELLPGGKVRPRGRRAELSAEDEALARRVSARLAEAGFQPPEPDELAASEGVPRGRIEHVLSHLADTGAAVHVSGELWLDGGRFEEARSAVVANCERNGRLEIPELRDALGTTRKFLIPLLEHLDAKGVTLRQAGHRVLKRRR